MRNAEHRPSIARYIVKDANDAIHRHTDGKPLPCVLDETLWGSGWALLVGQLTASASEHRGSAGGRADPSILTRMSEVSETKSQDTPTLKATVNSDPVTLRS